MILPLLRFEVFYQGKQRALPLIAALFLLLGFMTGQQGMAPANVNFNSPYQIYFYTGIMGLGIPFIAMFFAISSILRDKRHRSEHLIYSTSVKKAHFFISRFLGAFLFSLLAFSPFLIGNALGVAVANLDPNRVAEFNVMNYVLPWLYFVVPNALICVSLVFSVSTLSKNHLATYGSAIFIYMLYMIGSLFLNSPLMAQSVPASPQEMMFAAIADPFGMAAYFEQTQLWTPFQKNTQQLSFSGLLMWNRIIWITFSVIMLTITYALFSFRKLSGKIKKKQQKVTKPVEKTPYFTINFSEGKKFHFKALLSLLKMELKSVFKSLPFLAVIIIWIVIVFSSINAVINEGGAYGDSLHPFTNLLIELFVDPLSTLSIILIVFYSGELVWRERSLHFNGILDATPVANWVLFLSKFITLLILPVLLIASGSIIAILFQISHGYYNFELYQYFALFYHYGLQLFIFSMMAIFVQSLVRHKYLGMGITGLVILFSLMSPSIGIEHNLLRFGAVPRLAFNNMTGYSGQHTEFIHLSIHWLAWGSILSLLSFKLWQRGLSVSFRQKLKQVFLPWSKWEKVSMTSLLVILLTSGSLVYYNTHVVNDYYSSTDILDYQEQYERKFKKHQALDRLYRAAMKTEVDLFPKEKRYIIKADYTLKNKWDHPISQIFVSSKEPLSNVQLENARLVESDPIYDTYLFEFNPALEPQETVNFKFIINKALKGYETSREIVENGSYLSHRNFEPILGYREGMEISDHFERKKRGLPEREEKNGEDDHIYWAEEKAGKVTYETNVSTDADEIAIASGKLIRQWTENGRNYYHYKSAIPIMPAMGYLSAKYAIEKENYKGIQFEHYYQKGHEFNLDHIASSTKAALDYCIENFGAYPFDYVRIAEAPGHWGFGGFAHPGVISMVEDRLYLTNESKTVDFSLVAKRTIHEVSHQWWGHTLAPKVAKGGSLLVEGFAKYTEAVVMEKGYGKGAIWQLGKTAKDRYFKGRAFASEKEPPLYLMLGQSYLSYGKGLTVMLALRDLMGEQKLNHVIRSLTEKYRNELEFHVQTEEFIQELYKNTPEQHNTLIDDWFRRIITYDLSIPEVKTKKLNNGKYEISMQVDAKRFQVQTDGSSTQISINEPLMIGVFAQHPRKLSKTNKPLYLQPHEFNQEKTEVRIVVDELPKYVAIDPFATRSDANFVNNLVPVEK